MTSDDKRIKLHNRFKDILGNNNVYFNPPNSTSLKYPCIIYNLSDIRARRSSNKVYMLNHAYQVILIGIKPYEDIKDRMVTDIPYSDFNRVYIQDGLYHYVYTIYES